MVCFADCFSHLGLQTDSVHYVANDELLTIHRHEPPCLGYSVLEFEERWTLYQLSYIFSTNDFFHKLANHN